MRRRVVMARGGVVVVALGVLGVGSTRALAHTGKPAIEGLAVTAAAGPVVSLDWTETGLTADTTSNGRVTYAVNAVLRWTFSCTGEEGEMEKVVRSERLAAPFDSRTAMVAGTITGSLSKMAFSPPIMPKWCHPASSLTVRDVTLTDVTNGVSAKADPVTLAL